MSLKDDVKAFNERKRLIDDEELEKQEKPMSEPIQAPKFDGGKIQMELLSPIALTKIAQVLTFGAKKYSANSWRQGLKWTRYLGAILRHLLAYIGGEDKDPETGLSHLAHIGCDVMFLLEFEETRKEFDDRYQPETVKLTQEPPYPKVDPFSGPGQAVCDHPEQTHYYNPTTYAHVSSHCTRCKKVIFDITKKPVYF